MIAGAICSWWIQRRPFPASKGRQNYLIKRYRFNVRLGNTFAIIPLVFAISIFSFGVVANNDWRYGLLMIGLALGLPIFTALAPTQENGVNFREAILAMSVKQKTPVGLMLFLNIGGCAMALVGLYHVAA